MTKDFEILFSKIKEANVKQRDLAKSVGIAPEHLNAMLNGRLKMNKNMYKRIKYWYEKIKDYKKNA